MQVKICAIQFQNLESSYNEFLMTCKSIYLIWMFKLFIVVEFVLRIKLNEYML